MSSSVERNNSSIDLARQLRRIAILFIQKDKEKKEKKRERRKKERGREKATLGINKKKA